MGVTVFSSFQVRSQKFAVNSTIGMQIAIINCSAILAGDFHFLNNGCLIPFSFLAGHGKIFFPGMVKLHKMRKMCEETLVCKSGVAQV